MNPPEQRIGDLGEFQLIDRLQARLGRTAAEGGDVILSIGDDAACIQGSSDRELLLTTDVQIEGRHFIQAAMRPAEIGSRSVAVSVSDIFAMGGNPDHLLISLGLPSDFLVSWAEGLYDGVRTECERWGCRVLGGNLARCEGPWFIDITVVGSVPTGTALRRSGARAGDTIWVSGFPGSSAVGLQVVRQALVAEQTQPPGSARSQLHSFVDSNPWATKFVQAFLQPQLRGELATELRKSGLVNAMLDISDGWVADLRNLGQASSMDAVVRLADLPRSPFLEEACRELELPLPETLVAPSDDYELLWAAAADQNEAIAELSAACGVPCRPIGQFRSGRGQVDIPDLPNGDIRASLQGWDHFTD